ncbi:MAG: SARP family transcriptional regulator, partial [Solirubrobacterales bacterium]|nr:SARP family transcriptional regulator [Solirubrobacterales bacterium]
MAAVEVMLLGPPRVERDGVAVAFDTRKALALLAHLALVERPRPRDVLAELLWPEYDTEHARGALRRTL